jgi:hypothetical protein
MGAVYLTILTRVKKAHMPLSSSVHSIDFEHNLLVLMEPVGKGPDTIVCIIMFER